MNLTFSKLIKRREAVSKVLMLLKPSPSSLDIPIYEISSKSKFQGICNKYKRLRILTDGKVCYAWDAQDFDHFTILNHLKAFGKNITGLKRFNFENGKVELSIPEGGEKEILKKFKEKFGGS